MHTPLRIAAWEDDAEDMSLLLACIDQSGIPAECVAFSSCKALVDSFIVGQYDLIFLDIYMCGMQLGIDVAARIREKDTDVTLAFTTASTAHTLESYRLKATSYLEKPLKIGDVREVLELAVQKRKPAPCVNLLIGGAYHDIPLDCILYFEQRNHAVVVNTLMGKLRTSQTVNLKFIEAMLPDTFLRCHHSYIANLKYIKSFDPELNIFTMQNGDNVYIRQQSLRKAAKAYENYLFSRTREGKT